MPAQYLKISSCIYEGLPEITYSQNMSLWTAYQGTGNDPTSPIVSSTLLTITPLSSRYVSVLDLYNDKQFMNFTWPFLDVLSRYLVMVKTYHSEGGRGEDGILPPVLKDKVCS